MMIHRTLLASSLLLGSLTLASLAAAAPPVLKSLDTQAVAPGGSVWITTNDTADLGNWTVVVELQSGKTFDLKQATTTRTAVKVFVPDVYAGADAPGSKANLRSLLLSTKQIYLKRGSETSNRLSFNVLLRNPILDSFLGTPKGGEGLVLQGGNWDYNGIYNPGGGWAVFDLPTGETIKVPVQRMPNSLYNVPVPLIPAYTIVGSLLAPTPQVFCNKTAAQQQTIATKPTKLSLLGQFGPSFPSNKLDVQLQRTPIPVAQPFKLSVSPQYDAKAPNRTIYYRAGSTFPSPDCQKVLVATVRNPTQFQLKVAFTPKGASRAVATVGLAPKASTLVFARQPGDGTWEVWGPETGSFTGSHPSISLEVGWSVQ